MQYKPLALLGAAAIAALIAAGCAKGGDQSSTTAPAATSAGSATTASKASGCGAGGRRARQDGVRQELRAVPRRRRRHRPALKNEKSRKNYAQTVAWIKNPQPPMAKLFPDVITEKDVADVAAYVQTL